MKLSAYTITKNEEEYLGYSIKSYIDYVDELIIVDDMSTDHTIAIAKSFGSKVKVFRNRWDGDKISQRAFAVSKCKGDWVFLPDGDEVYYQRDLIWMRNFIEIEKEIISLRIYFYHFWKDFKHIIKGHMWDMNQKRLCRNIPQAFSDEENIAPYKRSCSKDWVVAHYGYCKPDIAIRRKIEYYMRRDNPNCKLNGNINEALVKYFTNQHPFFSNNFNHPRYGTGGLYCCGSTNKKQDKVLDFIGEHPKIMQRHRLYYE